MSKNTGRVHSIHSPSRNSQLPFATLISSALLFACNGSMYYPDSSGPNPGDTPSGNGGSGASDSGAAGVAQGGSDPGSGTGTDPARSGSGGNGSGAGGGAASDCDTVKLQSHAILEKNCGGCHGPGTNVASFDYVLDTGKLEASGKLEPGNPDGSPLYRRMSTGEMPPAAVLQRPSPQEIAVIYQWIKACTVAPPPTPSCGEPVVDTTSMLSSMIADISRFDLRDRVFIRYFTLTDVRNAGACENELDIYRYALAKAVNALSQGTQIVPPVAIDQYRTVYRIDLRDYEWDAAGTRADKWELLVAKNPYAFELEQDDAQVLKDFTGTDVPFQSAAWFVNQGTQPPLYHDMLGIPATRQELERQLGVNIAVDIENADVWRSGFLDSGVSQHNRVIERHELPVSNARTLWISYDFAGNGGRENVFANPLDFEADGSEIIFTLPNGLHAYMIANAAGTRLDEAPDNIVVDPKQENHNVRNGISCMSCHEVGTKMKPDELRDFVQGSSDFDIREKQSVAELYPRVAEFESLVTRDSRLFLEAITGLNPPVGFTTDPVIEVFDRFDGNVDLKRAAAELGISPQTLLRELGKLDPALSPLGYGTIKRETFRDNFAETVCRLNLGITDDPACL